MTIKKGITWITILSIVFALVGCSAKQYTTEKAAIEQLVKDYFATAYNIDYKTWTGEEELAYLTPDQADLTKTKMGEFKESFTINQLTQKIDFLTIENVAVNSDTDGSAYCIVEITGTDNGTPFRQKIECLITVEKIDGKWLIAEVKVQKVE